MGPVDESSTQTASNGWLQGAFGRKARSQGVKSQYAEFKKGTTRSARSKTKLDHAGELLPHDRSDLQRHSATAIRKAQDRIWQHEGGQTQGECGGLSLNTLREVIVRL